MSKYPLSNVGSVILAAPGTYVVPCYGTAAITVAGRAAVGATITVNGRTMSVFGARTTSEDDRACMRVQQNETLKALANANYPAPHVYGGDFNMQPYANEVEYQTMLAAPYPTTDSWALAVTQGTAVAYNGAPTLETPTRNTRMDYVFFDQATPYLGVVGSQIVDNLGLSDHRPMMTTFDVR